jgi:hypothetical protein
MLLDLLSLHTFARLRCFYFALWEITKFENKMTFVGILSIQNFMKSTGKCSEVEMGDKQTQNIMVIS